MDLGCSFGTDALIFASLGTNVTGWDGRSDHLMVAERRAAFLQRYSPRLRSIRFERRDPTRLEPHSCDLLWAYDLLGRLDPIDPFLEAARRSLRPGGVLVVGDSIRLDRRQVISGAWEHARRPYGVPGSAGTQPFETSEIHPDPSRLLRNRGFSIVHQELLIDGLGALSDSVYRTTTGALQPWLFHLPRFARRRLIVATPQEQAAEQPRPCPSWTEEAWCEQFASDYLIQEDVARATGHPDFD
jgi:SAM-dependent methyltransferase